MSSESRNPQGGASRATMFYTVARIKGIVQQDESG
jgi:hypothetical protein